MKAIKLLSGFSLIALLLTSCYTEVIIDDVVEEPQISLTEVLQRHELWYVNINETKGNGEIPFLQRAFTITFDRGVLMANNNLVGFGKAGDGFGIDVGDYGVGATKVEIDHDIDGVWRFEVFQVNNSKIELYHKGTNTSYFLTGYQRSTFDYDMVYYDNIHYFLQEYDAWEKVYTSQEGALNDFDKENYLQFLADDVDGFFRSSIDKIGTRISSLQWDFEGDYTVYDVTGNATLKTLTLGYDTMGNDYFELNVINDSTIELYHPNSGTVYEFKGRGYIQYSKPGKAGKSKINVKKRRKTINPVMNIKSKRPKV